MPSRIATVAVTVAGGRRCRAKVASAGPAEPNVIQIGMRDGRRFPSQPGVVELESDEDSFEHAQSAGERNEDEAAPEQPGCAEYRVATVPAERARGMGDDIRRQGIAKRVHGVG